MYCKHCGKQIEEDARFCPGCGKSVQEGAPVAAPPNPAEIEPTRKKKKKSLFKRWWFWILVTLVLFFACSAPAEPVSIQPDVSEAEYKAMCEEIEFDILARNPDNYEGQMFKFTGEVIQVMEGTGTVDVRLNVTAVTDEYFEWVTYEDTIYVTLNFPEGSDKILDYDIITVYGVCTGSYSYSSIFGAQVTLPRIEAMYYELVE